MKETTDLMYNLASADDGAHEVTPNKVQNGTEGN